jgi:hypothetical protein
MDSYRFDRLIRWNGSRLALPRTLEETGISDGQGDFRRRHVDGRSEGKSERRRYRSSREPGLRKRLIIPISTAKKKVLGGAQENANAVATIMIEPYDSSSMKDVEIQAQDLLRQRHHLSADEDDDFPCVTSKS